MKADQRGEEVRGGRGETVRNNLPNVKSASVTVWLVDGVVLGELFCLKGFSIYFMYVS